MFGLAQTGDLIIIAVVAAVFGPFLLWAWKTREESDDDFWREEDRELGAEFDKWLKEAREDE